MSVLTKKPKADVMYVALESFTGPHGPFREGDRVSGSHPAVRHAPALFGPADADTATLQGLRNARRFDALGPPSPAPSLGGAQHRIGKPIPPERRMRCTHTLFVSGGVGVFAGDIRDSLDPFVKANRKYFEPAPPETK